ncbi:hypothetical protein [Paracoccus yeei]
MKQNTDSSSFSLLPCAHHGDPTTHSMNIRPGIPRSSDHPFQPHPTRLI